MQGPRLSLGEHLPKLAQLGVTRASLMLYLAPVYGALLAWVFLGEPPHGYHLLGAALILPGIRFAAPRPPPRTA